MIDGIILILVLLPLHGVVTDLREGKIKNYFILPSLLLLVLLTFFIDGFYESRDNLLSLAITVSFAYLFYKNNKWGAGDGKYLILLGLSTTIIAYLKGVPYLILDLFIYTFSIFLIYVFGYLIVNFKKIPRITLSRQKMDIINILFLSTILFFASFYTIQFLPKNYSFLIIFICMMLILPIVGTYIQNRYLKYALIGFGALLVVIKQLYIPYTITIVVYVIFQHLQDIFDQVFDIIDTRKIKIIHLKQGNILTKEARDKIKNESGIEVVESPLQGMETYNILNFYKESGQGEDQITIYKDIKLGIILYISYVAILLKSVIYPMF